MIRLWALQKVYEVYRGKFFNAVKSFYLDSKACVRVGVNMSECFIVNVGLGQDWTNSPGCLMYIWMVW